MSPFGKLTYTGRMKIEITKQDARKVTIIEKLMKKKLPLFKQQCF